MGRLNRSAFEALVKENLEWLAQQPMTLEREHIRAIVEQSPTAFYGADAEEMARLRQERDAARLALRNVLALSHRIERVDPENAAHLRRFCTAGGAGTSILREGGE